MNRRPKPTLAALTLTLTLTAFGQAPNHVPSGHIAPDAALSETIRKALPAGATQVDKPLPVELGPLGKVEVVLYRRSDSDRLYRGVVLVPADTRWRSLPLPDEIDSAGNYEEITTAILGADFGAPDPDASVPGGAKQGLAGTLPSETAQARTSHTESGQRALVILFYAHEFGKTESNAFGRVYVYDGTGFRIDEIRSHLLAGVRTAAVARMRLAP